MLASGLAALVGIFLLLQAAFASWRIAALFTLTLPVSLSGGVLAAFIARADMSLGAAGRIPSRCWRSRPAAASPSSPAPSALEAETGRGAGDRRRAAGVRRATGPDS